MTVFVDHPSDQFARHMARDATSESLTRHFEDVVTSGHDVHWRYGALQVLAAQAIARVELLEARTDLPDNVMPLRKRATPA